MYIFFLYRKHIYFTVEKASDSNLIAKQKQKIIPSEM